MRKTVKKYPRLYRALKKIRDRHQAVEITTRLTEGAFLDAPRDGRFRPVGWSADYGRYESVAQEVAGWVDIGAHEAEAVRLSLGGVPIAFLPVDRTDVRTALGGAGILGFRFHCDLIELFGGGRDSVTLLVEADGAVLARYDLAVDAESAALLHRAQRDRAQKRQWIRERLKCPVCGGGGGFVEAVGGLACADCDCRFDTAFNQAIVALTPAIRDDFRIDPTENISAMGYDGMALDFIRKISDAGGMVLDCGAGLKDFMYPNVVNLEIVDYPSTDIVGVGQRLPFRDDAFDGVLSIAVLEHVSDPFGCAKELVRVLKPGGEIICAVPFLQPEHGYPHHYFNMTRAGVLELFKDGTSVVSQEVLDYGLHPLNALHWFLSVYAAALPDKAAREFRDIRIGAFLSTPPADWLGKPIATGLPTEARFILACGTVSVFRKGG